jgi:type IX secretion system PorP/SprF family membrane protein
MAQQLPLSSQYYNNQFITNPALTGTKENVNAFLTHRSQWTGVSGAPQTSYLTVDGPIEAKNIGLGLNLHADNTDMISRIGAFVDYSYKLKLGEESNLFFGVALGVINTKIDFSKAVVRDKADPILSWGNQSKAVFSSDFGMAYRWKQLEIGAAVPQLLGNKIKYTNGDGKNSYYNLERSYQASLKYVFDIVKEKEITIYPLLMARYYETSAMLQYDANLVLDWKKVGWIGATYHSNSAVAVSAGIRYKGLSVGYAYDLGIASTTSNVGASSELLLGFSFGKVKNTEDDAAEISKQQEKDLVYDQALQTLKTKADTNEAEVQRLKAELAQMKTERLSMDSVAKRNPRVINLTENLMRTSSSNTFVDESGLTIMSGYYIVVGSFNNKENATKFKNSNLIKGYSKTQMIQNSTTKTFYIYTARFDKQADAEAELVKYKVEYNDAWVLKLE